METIKKQLMYWSAVLISGLFYLFLDDLAFFSRIGKHEEIWWTACRHLPGNQVLVCMARYDLLAIYITLGLLMYLGYKLVPIYQKRIFFIPILGILTFILLQLIIAAIRYAI